MKKNWRHIIVGIVLCGIILGVGATALAASGKLVTIQAEMDAVTVKVNDQEIATPSLLWSGTTYIPLREISEALDCTVSWNQYDYAANITNNSTGAIASGTTIGTDAAFQSVAISLSTCLLEVSAISSASYNVLLYYYADGLQKGSMESAIESGKDISALLMNYNSDSLINYCKNAGKNTTELTNILDDINSVAKTANFVFSNYENWSESQKIEMLPVLTTLCHSSMDLQLKVNKYLSNWQ